MPNVEGRFDRIAGLIELLRSIDDYVVLSAVPALVTSIQTAKKVSESADYSNPEDLRKVVDAVLMVIQAGALCTVTDRDDDMVDMVRKLRTSVDFLIPIISQWLEGNKFGATEQDAMLAGIDPATIVLIVELVVRLIEFWRKRR